MDDGKTKIKFQNKIRYLQEYGIVMGTYGIVQIVDPIYQDTRHLKQTTTKPLNAGHFQYEVCTVSFKFSIIHNRIHHVMKLR